MRPQNVIETMAAQQVGHARDRKNVLKRLLKELIPYKRLVAEAFFFIFIQAVSMAAGPWLVGRAIDHDVAGHDGGGLAISAVILLGIYGVGAVAGSAQVQRIGAVGQYLLHSMRGRLFAQLQALPLSYFDKRPIGDLMSRLLSDVETLNTLFSQGLTQVLGSLFGVAGIMIAMIALDFRLALVCYTIIPAMLVTTWFFAARARIAFRKTRETVGDVTADLQEKIVGVRQAQAFNRTDVNIVKFRARNAANRDANVAAVGVTSGFSPAIDVLSTLSTALVIGFGGWLVSGGSLTIGTLAAFLTYTQQFFRPVQLAAQVYTIAQAALAGSERIYSILDEPRETVDPPDAKVLGKIDGRITFDKVTFAYVPNHPVLEDVSFEVTPGQTVAIVGRTGAGKTTIASLIPRFYDVTGGAILVDGIDVREVTRKSLRAHMAMVPQEPFLFTGSLAENIAYGRPTASRAEVVAAARAASAHDFIAQLPKGYDALLGEGGATLSQGQRQLIAFARAVLADPRILILDEATANIDTRTEAAIQTALKTLLAGRTSVVIAHRLSTIRNADQILVLETGKLVEDGPHDALMEKNGLYADLYRRQFRDPNPVSKVDVESATAAS